MDDATAYELRGRPRKRGMFRNKWFLAFAIMVVFTLGSLLRGFLLAPTWKAHVTFVINDAEAQNGVAALAGALTGKGATTLDLVKGLLDSNTARSDISQKTGIPYEKVDKVLDIFAYRDRNQLAITAETSSKIASMKTINVTVAELNKLNQGMELTTAERQAVVIRQRLDDAENVLSGESKQLMAYMSKLKTPMDPSTLGGMLQPLNNYLQLQQQLDDTNVSIGKSKSMAEAMAKYGIKTPTALQASQTWASTIDELKYRLASAKDTYGPDSPQVMQLQDNLKTARAKAQSAINRNLDSILKDLDPGIAQLVLRQVGLQTDLDKAKGEVKSLPRKSVEMRELYEKVVTQMELVEQLRTAYEATSIDADVARTRWFTLDPPYIENRPANKNYFIHAAIGAAIGALLAALLLAIFPLKTEEDKGR